MKNHVNTENLILATDSYKLGHYSQYPEGTEGVYSYFEAREGAHYPTTKFFGLQYILKRYLVGDAISEDDIDLAYELSKKHFGNSDMFNMSGWNHIYWDHKGRLPLRIKAVPEGALVPTGNVMMTVENTCPKCYWLTNALESLLVHVWYASTVATLSHHALEMIGGYLDKTGCGREGLPFMLHDFGYRGASSHETAAVGGMAHLLNARGTDTLPGMLAAMEYYGAGLDDLGFSVPATEHSVMTARGREGEVEVVGQLLKNHPTGIISCVSDSYDVENFITMVANWYHDDIMERDGKFVFRPDSLRRDNDTPELQMVALSNRLWELYGGTTNEAGFKELDLHVGLLWGDGIGPEGIDKILAFTAEEGFAASNYVFGMGGGLLQKVNRDVQRFAFKASAVKHGGEWHPVHKGTNGKKSKADRLKLHKLNNGDYETQVEWIAPHDHVAVDDVLKVVFENGELVREYTFDEVRTATL